MYLYKSHESKKHIDYSRIEKKRFKTNDVIHIPISASITIAEIEQGDDFFISFDKIKDTAFILKEKIFQLSILNNLGNIVYLDLINGINHIKNVPFVLYKKNYFYYVLENKTRENIEKMFIDMYIKNTNQADYLSYFSNEKELQKEKQTILFSDISIFPHLLSGYEEFLNEERMKDIFLKISYWANLRSQVNVFDHFDIDTLRNFFFTLHHQLKEAGGSLPLIPNYLLKPTKADTYLTLRYHNATFSKIPVVIFDDSEFIPFSVRQNLEILYSDYLKKPFHNKLSYKIKNEV